MQRKPSCRVPSSSTRWTASTPLPSGRRGAARALRRWRRARTAADWPGGGFPGVVDLLALHMKIVTHDEEDLIADIPEYIKGDVEEARQKLIESVAEFNNELLEKYIEARRSRRSRWPQPHRRHPGGQDLPGLLRFGQAEHRRQEAHERHGRVHADAVLPRRHRHGSQGRRPQGAPHGRCLLRAGLQDDRRPVRRSHELHAHLLRYDEGRCDLHASKQGEHGARRHDLLAAGQAAGASRHGGGG